MIFAMSLEAFTILHAVLVAVAVTLFGEFDFLRKRAPTGSELPLAIPQGIVLLFVLAAGYRALRKPHLPIRL